MTPDTTTNKARKRRDRPFPWPCVNCLKDEVYPEKMPYSVKIKHDGRLHDIQIPEITIPKCRACGELVFSNSVDDQITDALRSHLRLLTPEQIKAGRKALGLKSKELAKRLGVADATVSRWEKRMMIQSRAMDNLLRVYFAVPEARIALQGPNQVAAPGAPTVAHLEIKQPAADLRNGRGRREAAMVDTALIGRAKELEVAGVLIRNGIYVFWPLVDTGADLLATNRDASICIPVQVKYRASGHALNLYEADMKRFEKPNTVIAFMVGAGNQQRSWFLPYDAWRSKMVDNKRRDKLVFVPISSDPAWLARYEGDAGVRMAFGKLTVSC